MGRRIKVGLLLREAVLPRLSTSLEGQHAPQKKERCVGGTLHTWKLSRHSCRRLPTTR